MYTDCIQTSITITYTPIYSSNTHYIFFTYTPVHPYSEKPKKPGVQVLQYLPVTPGLQGHCPDTGSHIADVDPSTLQSHGSQPISTPPYSSYNQTVTLLIAYFNSKSCTTHNPFQQHSTVFLPQYEYYITHQQKMKT